MIAPIPEQRNAYKGSPLRAWVRLNLVEKIGAVHEVQLLADTGNPFALVISGDRMRQLRRRKGPTVNTNFGMLSGGWVRVTIPELGFDRRVLAYASDRVVTTTKGSSSELEGLAGLPLLKMVEYGGNAHWFWLRPA